MREEVASPLGRPGQPGIEDPERMTTSDVAAAVDPRVNKRVIFASSLGTLFGWYDFYLYATLAPFFAGLFFPKGNETAALLSAFATYAAGFLIRPVGALVFGRIGDLVGRKYTFLVTLLIMGASTFAIGLLPTFETIGWVAPVLLVSLRLLQGLAMGGEYGGAATYVAEHALDGRRGLHTSWLQTTATLGFLMSLVVIGLCRFSGWLTEQQFIDWGWRLPFLVSLLLLVLSIYVRLKLDESPVYWRMKTEGKGSKSPLVESFLRYPNNRLVLFAIVGATAGQGVVWYTGQFFVLFFLTITLKVDEAAAYMLVGAALILATPLFVFFGWLSDRLGRLMVILPGCLIAGVTYFPLFDALTGYVNPALNAYVRSVPIVVTANDCNTHIFVGPWSQQSACDKARDYLTKAGLSFTSVDDGVLREGVVIRIGRHEVRGWDDAAVATALIDSGYPGLARTRDAAGNVTLVARHADRSAIAWGRALLVLFTMVAYVAMVYGPIAAFLTELFPTRIRYTSMSLPYNIGNGWFGGMLPLVATATVAATGDIHAGLWYPVAVALMSALAGALLLRESKDRRIDE
jgi:MFS family permease